MEWYIGQEIVAIIDHSQGLFKKGDEFVIRQIRPSRCKCYSVILDVGMARPGTTHCGRCNIFCIKEGNWFGETCFAPKEPAMSELTIEALLEELEIKKEPV